MSNDINRGFVTFIDANVTRAVSGTYGTQLVYFMRNKKKKKMNSDYYKYPMCVHVYLGHSNRRLLTYLQPDTHNQLYMVFGNQ